MQRVGGRREGWSRIEAVTVLIFMASGGIAALDAQAVFYLMPLVAADLALNNVQVGLIGTATMLTWSLSGLAIALLSDRLGRRKPFLIGAFVLFALLSGASALANGFAALLAARLLIGLAEGPVIPVEQAIVMAITPPSRRGFNMGLAQNVGAQLFGTLVGPLVLLQIAERLGWHRAFLVAGVPGLLIAALIWRFVPEPPRDETRAGAARRPIGAVFASMLRQHNLRLSLIITILGVGWYFTQLTFLPLWLTRGLGLSPGAMSVVIAMVGAAGCIGSLAGPALSDRIGRRPAMILLALLGLVAPLGVLLSGPHVWPLAACVFVGSLMIGLFPLCMSVVPLETVAAEDGATAVALVICVGQIVGGVLGPAAGGAIAESLGLRSAIWLEAALAAGAALAACGLRERSPGTARMAAG